MIVRWLIIYLAAFSIVACKESRNEVMKGEVVKLELSGIKKQQSYRILKVLPLETRGNNLLGLNLRIKLNEKGIFVLDEENKDAVHHFGPTGKYLGPLALVGEGPGQIQNPYDLIVGDSTVSVLTGKGDHSEIAVFSYGKIPVKTLELDIIGDSFERLDNGNYIVYAGYNYPFVKYRLYEFSPEGQRVKENLINDYKNEMIPVIEKNFYKHNGRLYFKESFNANTYEITEDSLIMNYSFDFGKYQIPGRFWEMNLMDGFEMISSSGFANIYNYMENERYSLFEVYLQQERNVQNIQVIYDKAKETVAQTTFQKDDNSLFYHPIGFSDNNELIFLTLPRYLKELEEKENLDPGIKELIDGLDGEDNPVLLFCKIQ